MKKALYSTAAAALFLFTLSGCADTAPVQTEDHLPQPTAEITMEPSAEPTGPVESEAISFSAGDDLLAEDEPDEVRDGTASVEPTPSPKPEPTAKPSAAPAPPAETQPPPHRRSASTTGLSTPKAVPEARS